MMHYTVTHVNISISPALKPDRPTNLYAPPVHTSDMKSSCSVYGTIVVYFPVEGYVK